MAEISFIKEFIEFLDNEILSDERDIETQKQLEHELSARLAQSYQKGFKYGSLVATRDICNRLRKHIDFESDNG